jgi:hypothetical protein
LATSTVIVLEEAVPEVSSQEVDLQYRDQLLLLLVMGEREPTQVEPLGRMVLILYLVPSQQLVAEAVLPSDQVVMEVLRQEMVAPEAGGIQRIMVLLLAGKEITEAEGMELHQMPVAGAEVPFLQEKANRPAAPGVLEVAVHITRLPE